MKVLPYKEHAQALDQTIKTFGLVAAHLAYNAGVHENTLSDYRRGNADMLSTKLLNVIRSLPVQGDSLSSRSGPVLLLESVSLR